MQAVVERRELSVVLPKEEQLLVGRFGRCSSSLAFDCLGGLKKKTKATSRLLTYLTPCNI